MMLDLFPKLNEFDLSNKVGVLIGENKDLLSTIEGQLMEIGQFEITDVETKSLEINETESQLNREKLKLESLEIQFQKLNELKKLIDELAKKKLELNAFEIQKPDFDLKKEKIEKYDLIFKKFDSDLKLLDVSTKAVIAVEKNLFETRNQTNEAKEKLEQEVKKNETLKEKISLFPQFEKEISDLKLALESKKLESEFILKKEEANAVKLGLEKLFEEKFLVQKRLEIDKILVEKLETEQQDTSQLLITIQIYKDLNRLLTEKKIKTDSLTEINNRINELKMSKDRVLKNNLLEILPQLGNESKIKDIIQVLEFEKEKSGLEFDTLQNQILDLGKKEQLFHFSTQIKDGDPCPLCGANHHPDIISAEDVSAIQEEVKRQLSSCNSKTKMLELCIKMFQEIAAKLLNEVNQEKIATRELEKTNEAIDKINAELASNPLGKMGLELAQEKYKQLNDSRKELLSLKSQIKEAELKKWEIENRINPENENLNALNQIVAGLEGQISSLKNQAQNQNIHLDSDQIERRLKELSDHIERTKEEFDKQNLVLQEIERKHISLQATLSIQIETLENSKSEEKNLSNLLTFKVENEALGSLEEIRSTLAQNLDTVGLKNEIASFFEDLRKVEIEIKNIEIKINQKEFDENEWTSANNKRLEIKQNLVDKEGLLAVLKEQELQLKLKIQKLEKLKLEKKNLENRRDNLNLLFNLFRGNAFVNYASSVYLKNVVEIANQRFSKLTKQKLRLVLDGENTFYVKDFLNNGHERLAKTLSGGQIFQASLSLALALADTVRNLTKSSRNFFFLDEGFGSLDKESLQLVFDTLRQLRHENRVVGVISHIEEMQLEIDNCLKIVMDEEKGSLIELMD
jgi:exonuclease SbcC